MSSYLESHPISLLIPVKNAGNWLKHTLKGIIANVGPMDEIVIVDNDSSDQSIQLLQHELKDYNVKYFKNSGGLADSLNFGLEKCQNLWVARFDADDTYPSTRLVEQRKAICKAKGVAAIFSDYRILGNGVKYLGYIPTAITPLATEISLFNSQRTPHSSSLLNKESVLGIGGYSQKEFPAEDLGLWLRLARKHSLIGIPFNCLDYNLNLFSITGQRYRESKQMTRLLNERYQLSTEKLFRAIEDLESTLSFYSQSSHFPERTLLHLLELVAQPTFGSLGLRQQKKVLLEILKQSFVLSNIESNLNLLRFKIMRKLYRIIPKYI